MVGHCNESERIVVQETPSSSRFRFRLRILLMVTLLVAIPLTGYVMWRRAMDGFFHEMLVGDTGPVSSREDWPRPLLELIEEIQETGLKEDAVQVYCLCRGIDLEYVWRMRGGAKLFDFLKDKWKLTQVDNPDWHALKGYSQNSGVSTPSWWSPRQDDQTAFYVCPQELANDKGDRFQVAFDPVREAIFVHYWSNF